MDRLDELTAAYLDAAISPGEALELAELLEHEPDRWSQLLESRRLEQLLHVVYRPNSDEAVEAILRQIRAEDDPFVESVAREIDRIPRRQTRSDAGIWERGLAFFTGPVFRFASAITTAVVILGLGLRLLFPTSGQPVIESFQGPAPLLERQSQPMVCLPGIELRSFDRLQTTSNTVVVIAFGKERTHLRLAPGTQFRIGSLRGNKEFELDAGEMQANVARQALFRPMIITTPEAQVRVVGTEFTLTERANTTHLEVIEGKVRLTPKSAGKTVMVVSGQSADAGAGYETRALPITGKVSREWWTGATETSLAAFLDDPRFPNRPSGRDLATEFEFGPISTNHLAVRIHGFVHPPVTGTYEFWVTGATDAALFLSKDESRRTVRVAEIEGPDVKPRSWGEDSDPLRPGPNQRSIPVELVAGRRYYVEAIVLIEEGEGHLSVAWQPPGAKRELLGGKFLSPADK
jgi:hypothetical protein